MVRSKKPSAVIERQRGAGDGEEGRGRCYLNAQQPMRRSLVTPERVKHEHINTNGLDGPQEKKRNYVTVLGEIS
jgi:hypothetical protein